MSTGLKFPSEPLPPHEPEYDDDREETMLDDGRIWVTCWNCGGEGTDPFDSHDCGEDVCCCHNPEPNVGCDICEGQGGWYKKETV